MFFFKKKDSKVEKKYKWEPVATNAQTILRIIEYSIDTPLCRLIIKCKDIVYKIGVTSNYTTKRGYFDIVYYINDKQYEEYQEFKRATDIENTPLEELLEVIHFIADEDMGDPRNMPIFEGK